MRSLTRMGSKSNPVEHLFPLTLSTMWQKPSTWYSNKFNVPPFTIYLHCVSNQDREIKAHCCVPGRYFRCRRLWLYTSENNWIRFFIKHNEIRCKSLCTCHTQTHASAVGDRCVAFSSGSEEDRRAFRLFSRMNAGTGRLDCYENFSNKGAAVTSVWVNHLSE